ncbi:hypothetical protein HGRIS_009496 [Hohenbuehelia grisea]|uniref:Mannosyl phosphorylinositol ceramide synthase SUR1 n=1 Tax=Hohenbuehelia grisea TaxID=104357 RepID=A0ABR3J1R6_9AGAR
MARRKGLFYALAFLGLFLTGTVVVLSSVTYYLAIEPAAYLTEVEVPFDDTRWNVSETERIPRILHQTWKTDTLPAKWKDISQACRDMMPDYEYKLWTDENSRRFIQEQYPWFLETFDGYPYNIQRADAIRYFVLHHYGGVYLDLDIGCLRPLDPLLKYPVILPKTIPVGVSNDLMFAEKGHPFLQQTIHNLITFDHSWILNYPTVMFSTGPMFLSIQYGLWSSSQSPGHIRILPKSLYGKNAKEGEAPHSFFSHFYGSSWHADDAAFIGFLGLWGKGLMWLGLALLLVGLVKLALPSSRPRRYSLRRIGGYDVLLPRWSQRSGRWHLDLGWFSLPASAASTVPSSPNLTSSDASEPNTPLDDHPLLHLPFDDRSPSPSVSDIFYGNSPNPISDAVRRLRDRVATLTGSDHRTPVRGRRTRSRGVLFFLPAIFHQSPDIEMNSSSERQEHETSLLPPYSLSRQASQWPPEKQRFAADFERAGLSALSPLESETPSSSSAAQSVVDFDDTPSQHPSRSASRTRDP